MSKQPKRYISDIPELMAEWNWEKNNELGLDPSKLTHGSKQKAWWICEKGHEWKACVLNRTHGNNCPHCSNQGTSVVELIVLYYIQKYSPVEVIHRAKHCGVEIDIYIPSMKIGIEYDGHYYHKDIQKDLDKNKQLDKHNIKLYRIREQPLKQLNSTSVDLVYKRSTYNYTNLCRIIEQLILKIFSYSITINEEEDKLIYFTFMRSYKQSQSFALKYPDIAKEWNYIKNKNLTPEHFSYGSGAKVWWKCSKCGHEWEMTISDRSHGHGCPKCARVQQTQTNRNNRLKTGQSLYDLHPDIAKQWNYCRNGNLKPTDIMSKSNIKVWWICEHGHEWQAKVASRSNGNNCPYCSNRYVWKGYNDLKTIRPDLAQEWNYAKNKGLTPEDVTWGSGRKVWWKCNQCGYEWDTTVNNRSTGYGCPECGRLRKAQPKKTSEQFKQELYKTNTNIQLLSDYISSKQKITCKCLICEHQWEVTPASLLYRLTPDHNCCPNCAKKLRGHKCHKTQ